MRVVADADINRVIIERLRADGHEVHSIAERGPRIPDEVVVTTANAEGALLITQDKGFGELVVRYRLASLGIVLLRLGDLKPIRRAAIVSAVLERIRRGIAGSLHGSRAWGSPNPSPRSAVIRYILHTLAPLLRWNN
jgi:predicted nuclease of predicted toxin-antitoxin system